MSVFLGMSVIIGSLHAQTTQPQARDPGLVNFVSDPASREVALARQVFSQFLSTNPSVRLEAAFMDVNGDGVAELATRFVSPQTCTRDRCATFIQQYSRSERRWNTIFERRTSSIRQGLMPDGTPALQVNGNEIWLRERGNDGNFVGTLRGRGNEVWLTERVPANVLTAARNAVSSIQVRPELVTGASFEMGPGIRAWAVSMNDGACGGNGCPFVVLIQERNQLRHVYTGVSDSQLVVITGRDRTMHDLGVPEAMGFRIARWDGAVFRDFETSYPSRVTPAP
jgi:hypothetical protein